jgi:DNA polymerase-3 subunit delta'
MPFSSLIGNEQLKQLLQRGVTQDRIAQGLLFSGPRGVGKHQFALALAQALNCDRVFANRGGSAASEALAPDEKLAAGDACGQCIPCRKIAAGEHSDVETYRPDGQFIKIDQMRELSEKAQYRPYEGRRRVYIIDEAERLRLEAANSILKTLEEPPDCTALVLVTSKPYALLDTIRSRCLMLNFAPLAEGELETYLTAAGKLSGADAALVARLASGSIGEALEIDLTDYRQRRDVMLNMLEALVPVKDSMRLLGAAEYLGRKLEREDFEKHLETLLVLLQDVTHVQAGEPDESLINADAADRVRQIAERAPFEQIVSLADGIERIFEAVTRNVHRQLLIESLLFAPPGETWIKEVLSPIRR